MAITRYHIGCTGWSLKEWTGRFFTDDARPEQFLTQYASVFNAVEGNTTFYGVPDQETVRNWGRCTPDGFKFCFKFHRSLTHVGELAGSEEEVLRFLEVFDPIAERLGPFHIQLPTHFSPEQFPKLERLLGMLPRTYAYAVEVRHPGFFDHGRVENRLNRLLKSYNVDRVTFDTRKLHAMPAVDPTVAEAKKKKPKLPVRFETTGSRPFVRFVGANDALNNETYLKEWAIVAADWIREGLHPYIFTHSPDRVSQPSIARAFHRMLGELIEMEPMPPWPVERQDEQLDLF
ncbi:MAG: DUF72 domain-containing protein [Balneolaceae bacterium]|nr:DUF72 domain-containing protein [Balneolaceae bacterium]